MPNKNFIVIFFKKETACEIGEICRKLVQEISLETLKHIYVCIEWPLTSFREHKKSYHNKDLSQNKNKRRLRKIYSVSYSTRG